MGILDWFKSRPSFFEPDRLSDDTTTRAIEKAVTLTNPRMKLIHSYRDICARWCAQFRRPYRFRP